MLPTPQINVTSENQIHQQAAQQVAGNLHQMGYKIQPEAVTGYNHQTPIQKTADLQKVDADIIGADDLAYMMKNVLNVDNTTRTMKSRNPLNILLDRLKRKG